MSPRALGPLLTEGCPAQTQGCLESFPREGQSHVKRYVGVSQVNTEGRSQHVRAGGGGVLQAQCDPHLHSAQMEGRHAGEGPDSRGPLAYPEEMSVFPV